jgi:putative transposase
MDLTLSGEHYFARLRVANHEFEKLFSLQSIQGNAPLGQWMALDPDNNPVLTENSVRSENAEVPIIREIMVATTMSSLLVALFALVASSFRTRAALQAEILALRHQLAVFQKNAPGRLRLQRSDRFLWVLLSRFWSGWRRCLQMVQADTVLRWHRRAFAWYWTRKSRRLPGRPEVAADIRDLIRRMRQANPLWGAPRIHGELLKLGIKVAPSTVARYLPRARKPPSQTWRTFLTNHLAQTAAIDFFTVPTATFRVLFVFVVLSHERRRVVHFGVTEHPTQEWTMQQLREAFPWNQAPRYVLRDRDAIYGQDFAGMMKGMGMEEVMSAPRSPWQNPYVERIVGSIRRECLDHVIVWNERSLRRSLRNYFAYYHRSRTHLSLGKDSPEPRPIQPLEMGPVVVLPQVGGLHHRYERRAA